LHWISRYGYIGIFSLLMFGIIGVPVPDETLLTFSGYLVCKGHLGMFPTIASAFLGSACGISVSYWIGRSGGLLLIRRFGQRAHITPEKVERVRQWLDRSGRWGLVIGYFIPGVRHFTAVVAGASRLKFSVFAVFAYTGALLWSSIFIVAGFFIEKGWLRTTAAIHRIVLIACAAIVLALLVYYLVIQKTRAKGE
jgi:membrane protein DedA with SNARE-associated domain